MLLLQSIPLSSVGGRGGARGRGGEGGGGGRKSRWAKSSPIFVGVRACQNLNLPNCQIKLVHHTVPVMADVQIVEVKRCGFAAWVTASKLETTLYTGASYTS